MPFIFLSRTKMKEVKNVRRKEVINSFYFSERKGVKGIVRWLSHPRETTWRSYLIFSHTQQMQWEYSINSSLLGCLRHTALDVPISSLWYSFKFYKVNQPHPCHHLYGRRESNPFIKYWLFLFACCSPRIRT